MFDPFGDFDRRGYLRNNLVERNPNTIRELEHAAFAANLGSALTTLQSHKLLSYDELLPTNEQLFSSLYPWAGKDRQTLVPNLIVSKSGMKKSFAPAHRSRALCERTLAASPATLQGYPGTAFALMALAHPFLDTNGRTLLTIHTMLLAKAGVIVRWNEISKYEFLRALTMHLDDPRTYALDTL